MGEMEWKDVSENQIAQVSYRHAAIVDYMLVNPDQNQNEIARALGFTPAWLSVIINSDAFKMYYESRREEHNTGLHEKVVGKLYAIALDASDVILDALGEDEVDARLALDAKDKALHRLGYGPSRGGAVNIQQNNTVHNYPVDKELLQRGRERMNSVHRPALEGIVEEVPSCGEDN